MTEDQQKLLDNFEIKLHRVIYLCDELKKKKLELEKALDQEKMKNEILTVELNNLRQDYSNLKTATMLSLRSEDVKDSKKRLVVLVREIDKCISLMND